MDEDREIEGTRAPLNFFEEGGGGHRWPGLYQTSPNGLNARVSKEGEACAPPNF